MGLCWLVNNTMEPVEPNKLYGYFLMYCEESKELSEKQLWEQYELERNEYQNGFAAPGEYFPCFDDWKASQ
jgi:hypothetical protein